MIDEFVDPKETRTPEQKEQYEEINRSGKCPFCIEQFSKIHKSKILKENESWLVTENDTPYEGSMYHFLFVFKTKHIVSFDELDKKEKLDLFELFEWINKEYKIKSGSFVMRYGGPGNGSSVRHLHAHVVVGGNDKDKNSEGLKVKIGYKK